MVLKDCKIVLKTCNSYRLYVNDAQGINPGLKLIKKNNRRLGQLISDQSAAGRNVSPEDKEIYKSRKETLKIYRE